MAIFESGSRKVLKKIRKFATEGSVNRISTTVKEDRNKLLEESGVAFELIELLLEIGHPNLAADIGEETMRRHRHIVREVQNLFIQKLTEFPRSIELLRVTWKSFLDKHDYRGALNVLMKADEIAVSSFFSLIKDRMSSSIRFDGTIHPEADQPLLIEWGLCLYQNEKPDEAIDFLWKVCREVEFPHRDIASLAFWIGNQVKHLASSQWISLMGISAVSGKMERAMQYANQLSETDTLPDDAIDAASVIEKWMIPADRSGRSSALLAEMYTIAGRTEAASKILEDVYSDSLDREKLETAIEDLVSHPESGAAPLLLSARMDLENGKIDEATEAIEKVFTMGEADSHKLIEVCRNLISATGDTTGTIAVKLASYLVAYGEVKDAVHSLFPIMSTNASWVFEQVQRLLSRDKNSASVLSLLAAVLFRTGKRGKAAATLDHLSRRTDKGFCKEAVIVFDSLEDQIIRYPELRESRAMFRLRSDRKEDAASDWFKLLLTGRNLSEEGLDLLRSDGIEAGSVSELIESGFSPNNSSQAFIAALIGIREKNADMTSSYLLRALDDNELHNPIAEKLSRLPDNFLRELDLRNILPWISSGEAASKIAGIIEKLGGSEDWKISLVTELEWENPAEQAQFRLKYLLSQGKVVLAGSSYIDGTIDEPSIKNVALACMEIARDNVSESLELLKKPVTRSWTSRMSREVLEYLLISAPALDVELRELIAISYETEKKYDDLMKVLDPVKTEDGVLDLLEEMLVRHPGELAISNSLTRASFLKRDFPRFQEYSAVMLDLDSGSAEELVGMAASLAKDTLSGEAYLYTARMAHKHKINMDTDDLIIQAILLQPELSSENIPLRFDQIGSIPRAVCSIAAGDSSVFNEILRKHPETDIPLNEELLEIAIGNWSPGKDAEALYGLTRSASYYGYSKYVERILSSVAMEGGDPWSEIASEKLLREVIAGSADSISFWKSVRTGRIITEALERLLPDGYDDINPEEAVFVAAAVLQSDQGIRKLFRLSDDEMFFPPDDITQRIRLGEACMRSLPDRDSEDALSPQECGKLIEILLSAGMISEAVSIANEAGTDDLFSRLKDGLQEARIRSSSEGIERASALVRSGDPEGALKEVGSLGEEYSEALDTRALALWNMGFRNQAISTWMNEYRKTGEEAPLKRLAWTLKQAGASMERTALQRFLAGKHPGLIGIIKDTGIPDRPGELELLSGLRISSKMKKVKNG